MREMEYKRKVDKRHIPTCNIMGVNIAAINMEWLVDYLEKNISEIKGDYICVSNVHTTVTSFEDADYCAIQNGGLMAIPDGGPLSTVGQKRGHKNMERTTGPWARVVKRWDSSYSFLRDKTECQKLQNYIDNNGLVKNMLNVFDDHMKSGKEHFETILISNQYRHEGLTIVPKKNMINNIGVVEGSAHYAADIELIPKGYRRIFTMNRYEINTNELKHPEIIKDYKPYLKNAYRIYGWGHPAVKIYRQIVSMFYYLKQGKIKELLSDTRQKIERVIKRTSS